TEHDREEDLHLLAVAQAEGRILLECGDVLLVAVRGRERFHVVVYSLPWGWGLWWPPDDGSEWAARKATRRAAIAVAIPSSCDGSIWSRIWAMMSARDASTSSSVW